MDLNMLSLAVFVHIWLYTVSVIHIMDLNMLSLAVFVHIWLYTVSVIHILDLNMLSLAVFVHIWLHIALGSLEDPTNTSNIICILIARMD